MTMGRFYLMDDNPLKSELWTPIKYARSQPASQRRRGPFLRPPPPPANGEKPSIS